MQEKITKLALKAATPYLQNGVNLNTTIKAMYLSGEIENEEVLKRVCELANKHVYLTIFKNAKDKRKNINFPVALSEEIVGGSMDDSSMNDYTSAPTHHKSVGKKVPTTVKVASDLESLQEAQRHSVMLSNFINQAATEKVASYKRVEQGVDTLTSNVTDLIANGESVYDICKVASEALMASTGNKDIALGVAGMITKQASEMAEKGYKVDFNHTKLASSFQINEADPFVQSINKLASDMMATAAFSDLEDGYTDVAASLDQQIALIDQSQGW